MFVSYPADGWLPPNAVFEWEHPDQGRDFVTNWRGMIQAPGKGCVVGTGSDAAFPNGFGPKFALVRIDTGPYRSPSPWYIGHTTSLVRDGQCFKFGQPLARADQGRPSQICDLRACEGPYPTPVNGGWVELGQQEPSGALGPNNGDAGHWYDSLLRKTLKVFVPDPDLKYGDRNWRVWGMTNDLYACGWLPRAYYTFNRDVHGAVVAYKKSHHIGLPKRGDGGIVNQYTRRMIGKSGNVCRRKHRKEYNPLINLPNNWYDIESVEHG